MAGNFIKHDGFLNEGDLPVDTHELVAMCAPRPVFISDGATPGDGWVDAKGIFMAAAAAEPVYQLLGKKTWARLLFRRLKLRSLMGTSPSVTTVAATRTFRTGQRSSNSPAGI